MPLGNTLNWLATNAELSNLLRRLVENNFVVEKGLVREHLLSFIPVGGGYILDLGCGTGELSHLIPPTGYFGVDILWEHLSHAATRHPDRNYLLMDGRSLAFPDACFDAILVSGVFHHMDEELANGVLKELQRVLKPDGHALILEDIPTRLWWNLPGQFIHAVDMGAYIRKPGDYARLIEPYFKIDREFPVLSGVCDYEVFVLTPLVHQQSLVERIA